MSTKNPIVIDLNTGAVGGFSTRPAPKKAKRLGSPIEAMSEMLATTQASVAANAH